MDLCPPLCASCAVSAADRHTRRISDERGRGSGSPRIGRGVLVGPGCAATPAGSGSRAQLRPRPRRGLPDDGPGSATQGRRRRRADPGNQYRGATPIHPCDRWPAGRLRATGTPATAGLGLPRTPYRGGGSAPHVAAVATGTGRTRGAVGLDDGGRPASHRDPGFHHPIRRSRCDADPLPAGC